MSEPTRAGTIEWARDLYEDLDFTAVRAWLAGAPGRKPAGYLPVYAPRELLHAAGFLPVGIHGAGDGLEIIRGDAFYQSYLPKKNAPARASRANSPARIRASGFDRGGGSR